MSECDYNNMGSMDGGPAMMSNGETRTNLIINYLPQSLTDQEFYKIFVVIGPIKNCRIMKDLKQSARQDDESGYDNRQSGRQENYAANDGSIYVKTGYSFGFGFVEYVRPEDAAKAILQLNNLPVQHKRIKVSYARPPGEDIKETNLYIQNIPRSYSLDQLEDLFSPFGQIVQKNLLKDKITGLPRGVGFVRYDKKSEAEAAIEQMNGVTPDGGNEPLVVKVAEEHGKMKAAYYAGYHAGLQTNRGQRGGRGRGNFNIRGGAMGYSRGNYNNTQGKMSNDRGNNRYHPVAGNSSWDDMDGDMNMGGMQGGGRLGGGSGYSNGGGVPPALLRRGGGGGGGGIGVPNSGGYRGAGSTQYHHHPQAHHRSGGGGGVRGNIYAGEELHSGASGPAFYGGYQGSFAGGAGGGYNHRY